MNGEVVGHAANGHTEASQLHEKMKYAALNDESEINGHSDGSSDDEVAVALSNENSDRRPSEAIQSIPSNGKKSKKKKKKKPASKRNPADAVANKPSAVDFDAARLRIARNKHMRFISSYHGPWLQLPPELLESLLQLNSSHSASGQVSADSAAKRERDHTVNCRACSSLDAQELARANANGHDHADTSIQSPSGGTGSRSSPPIDPAVFMGTLEVRKLLDEASDLAVRAASGLSAAALGALAASTAQSGGNVATALGLENTVNGRPAAMSATRQHRLRAMAVNKLAQAYMIDEVAASVAVMQGATAIDDIAEKVLRHDAGNVDAQLVQFFHEKIPSAPSVARAHAVLSPSTALDRLIHLYPDRLPYFRSLGIWQVFKHEYESALGIFTSAIEHAKSLRKTKSHRNTAEKVSRSGKKRNKGKGATTSHQEGKDHALNSPLSAVSTGDSSDGSGCFVRHILPLRANAATSACEESFDIGKEPGDDIERQMYFFRGMAAYQAAMVLVETVTLGVDKIARPAGGLANEAGDFTLDFLGVKVKPAAKNLLRGSLIGSASPSKLAEYERRFNAQDGSDGKASRITELLKQSNEDLMRFLSYFAVWEAEIDTSLRKEVDSSGPPNVVNQHLIRTNTEKSVPFRGRKLVHHRVLAGRTLYTDPRTTQTAPYQKPLLMTYHPLQIEAHFSILLNLLLLGDFQSLLLHHYRTNRLMDAIEGYPVFVPARSLNQCQYVELMELLAEGWLPAREQSGHATAPLGTSEDRIYTAGPLHCLQHLVSYFTTEHSTRLADAAEQAENDAAAAAESMFAERKPRKLVEAMQSVTAAEMEAEAGKTIEVKTIEAPPQTSAKTEISMAWLQISSLMPLEAEEAACLGNSSGPSVSTWSEVSPGAQNGFLDDEDASASLNLHGHEYRIVKGKGKAKAAPAPITLPVPRSVLRDIAGIRNDPNNRFHRPGEGSSRYN